VKSAPTRCPQGYLAFFALEAAANSPARAIVNTNRTAAQMDVNYKLQKFAAFATIGRWLGAEYVPVLLDGRLRPSFEIEFHAAWDLTARIGE
jgi:hypothetical protein